MDRISSRLKREGKLFYNGRLGRYDIRFPDGAEHGGLHCGDVIGLSGREARIEYSDTRGWYLIGADIGTVTFQGEPVSI